MPRKLSVPAYQLHKATGQAKVRIDGKDHYLGVHGTATSRERYDELITDWLASHSNPKRLTLTVGELVLMYLKHAREHYRKAGETTSEFKCVKLALGHLVADHSRTPVREFGPKALKYVRDEMVTAGYVRSSINRDIGRIRRLFAWGVSEELFPVTVLNALQTVKGLQAGRSQARESKPVKPVPRTGLRPSGRMCHGQSGARSRCSS